MVSLRFPFSFSQPRRNPLNPISQPITNSRPLSTASVAFAVAAGAAALAGVASATTHHNNPTENKSQPLLFRLCSLSLAQGINSTVVESKTGVSFPSVIGESRKLLGIGLRRKSVFGLKNIDVYAFGVYADDEDLKKLLGEKYGKLSTSAIKGSKEFKEDLMEGDISMTVRLQIVYGKLSIRSVRSAFEESVGSRLQKFGGPDNKELLQRFTSQFKDEYKIPRGSVIELSRERGYIMHTRIDGKEVGSIQSKLLCRSILDLYVGDDPFDKQAKEDIDSKLASLVQK